MNVCGSTTDCNRLDGGCDRNHLGLRVSQMVFQGRITMRLKKKDMKRRKKVHKHKSRHRQERVKK